MHIINTILGMLDINLPWALITFFFPAIIQAMFLTIKAIIPRTPVGSGMDANLW